MDFLVDPFEAEFVRTGALAAAIVGVLCAVVGCYVVLRGLALMADSLAHGVLPAVAIVFMLALGVALISRTDGYAVDLSSFLFGDVLGAEGSDVVISAVATVLVLGVLAALYRPFLLLSFDRQRAAAIGL